MKFNPSYRQQLNSQMRLHVENGSFYLRDETSGSITDERPLQAGYFEFDGETTARYLWSEGDKAKYDWNGKWIYFEAMLEIPENITQTMRLFAFSCFTIFINPDKTLNLFYDKILTSETYTADISRFLGKFILFRIGIDNSHNINIWADGIVVCSGKIQTYSPVPGQYPYFSLGGRDGQYFTGKVGWVKLFLNGYRFLWLCDYLQRDGNSGETVIPDVSKNGCHLTHGQSEAWGRTGDYASYLNKYGFRKAENGVFEPLLIGGDTGAVSRQKNGVRRGKISLAQKITGSACGYFCSTGYWVREKAGAWGLYDYLTKEFGVGDFTIGFKFTTYESGNLENPNGAIYSFDAYGGSVCTILHNKTLKYIIISFGNNNLPSPYGSITTPYNSHDLGESFTAVLVVKNKRAFVILYAANSNKTYKTEKDFPYSSKASGYVGLSIGRNLKYSNGYGCLKYASVYGFFMVNRALTDEEINALFKYSIYPTDLDVLLPFSEGGGSDIYNVGNGIGDVIFEVYPNYDDRVWSKTQNNLHWNLIYGST